MGRSVVGWFGLLVAVGLFGSLAVSCGDAQDADRDRNTQSIAGTACSEAGVSRKVGKVPHVCGVNGADLVWYAAASKKQGNSVCRKLGAVRTTNAKTQVCGNDGKKKLWITVLSLPTSMISSATSLPADGVAASTTTPEPTATDSASPSVAPPTTLSPSTTIAVPNSEVQKAAIALSAPSKGVLATTFTEAVSGAIVSPAPAVQLVDEGGNPRGRAGVVVKVLVDRDDVVVGGGQATTNDDGLAVFGNLVLRGIAGPVEVTLQPEGFASVSTSVELVPGAPVAVGFYAELRTVVAGTAWDAAAYLVDAEGNFAGPEGAEVTARRRGGEVLGKATTDEYRVARFSLPVRRTAGEWDIEFVGSQGIDPATVTLRVVPATADRLVIDTALPNTATNDTPIADELKVHVADRYGNLIDSEGYQVTLTLVPHELPISDNGAAVAVPQGTVKNGSATIDESGFATFNDPTIIAEAGTWNLTVGSPNDEALQASHVVKVVAGAAKELRFVRNPAGARSGVPITVQPSLMLVDVSGNVITDEGTVVTASAAEPNTVTNATATTGRDGVATFTNLTVSGKAGTITMSFDSALMPTIQKEISLAAGPIGRLNVLVHERSAVAGAAFTSDSHIGVSDAEGNAVTEPITVLGKCTGSDTWTGVQTNANGVATFSRQVVTRAGAAVCEYRYESGSRAVSASARVNVVAASATTVEFVTQPPTTASMGLALSVTPSVRLIDQYGNRVEQAGVSVTASVSDNSLEISNKSALTDASGIATFGAMTFGGTIGSYRLSFGPSGGIALQAAANTVMSAGAASQVEVRGQLDGLASGWRASSQPTLRVNDRWGNAVRESGWAATVTLRPVIANSSVVSMLEVSGNSATSGPSGQIYFVTVVVAGKSGVSYIPTYRVRKGLTELGVVDGAEVTLAPGQASQFTYEIGTKDDSFLAVGSGRPIGRIRQSDSKGNPVNAAGRRTVVVAYERGAFPNSGMSWGRQVEPDVTSDGVTTLGYRVYGGSAATGVLRVTVAGQAEKQYNTSLTSAAVFGDPGPSGGLLLSSSPSSPRFAETAPESAAHILYYTDVRGYVGSLTINGVANWTLPTAAHTTQMMVWSNAGRLNLPTRFDGMSMADSSMTVIGYRYFTWLPGIATKQSLPYGLGYYGVLPVRSFG